MGITSHYSSLPTVRPFSSFFVLASTFKTLSEDIRSMLDEPGFEDVVLKVNEQSLACNKFLLCAR